MAYGIIDVAESIEFNQTDTGDSIGALLVLPSLAVLRFSKTFNLWILIFRNGRAAISRACKLRYRVWITLNNVASL